jgi:CDP-6-deoxy-D-xylo-4-hexulose-3-dehydrase
VNTPYGAASSNPSLGKLKEEIFELVGRFLEASNSHSRFEAGVTHIPVSGKVCGVSEACHIVESALDGWFTTGRFNEQFERALADLIKVRRVLTTNSGSSANLVAAAALTASELGPRAIRPGDEFISVAASFPTTVTPLILYGAVPVFVDVDCRTGNIREELVEAAINPRTKAIMIAHCLGNPFNAQALKQIADKHNLWIIEDCCDALGARLHGQHVGTFGDIGTLSFYPAHHITTGEGGAVFSNNPRLLKIMESFRDWGRDCWCPSGQDNTCGKRFGWTLGQLPQGYDHKYIYSRAGFNLKLTDMQAALGLAQMARLPDFIATRRRNHEYLTGALAAYSDRIITARALEGAEPSWFGFLISLRPEAGISRTKVLRALEARNIGTRLLFAGDIRKQPFFQDIPHRTVGDLSQTEAILHHTFWVGVTPAISEEMCAFLAESLKEILDSKDVKIHA